MLNRRHVLSLLGIAPIAASCASSTESIAAAAWRAPGAGEIDPRRHALAHAILAPNPHNMQPWLVDLVGTNEIRLFVDPTRLLPVTDPPNRQITMGCGAFLELLDMAARQNGHRADIQLWPEGEPYPTLDARPVAHVTLTPDAGIAKDPLYPQIQARRTSREPFDAARVPSTADLSAVAALNAPNLQAGFTNDPTRVTALRDIAFRGWMRELETRAAIKESVDVMRIGKGEIEKHRDGLAMDFPMVTLLKALGQLTPEKLTDPNSMANKEGVKIWRALAETAPAFIWISSADIARTTQINAGRAYARQNLNAAALGLSMHPWSMALQEYPEMADIYREQQVLLGATPAAPIQMLARIGYGPEIEPSPRRGLEAHVRA